MVESTLALGWDIFLLKPGPRIPSLQGPLFHSGGPTQPWDHLSLTFLTPM